MPTGTIYPTYAPGLYLLLILTHFLSARTKKAEVNISTVGVDVCDWIYPKKTDFAFGRADNRPSIKFSTWDFGGQVRVLEGRGG